MGMVYCDAFRATIVFSLEKPYVGHIGFVSKTDTTCPYLYLMTHIENCFWGHKGNFSGICSQLAVSHLATYNPLY